MAALTEFLRRSALFARPNALAVVFLKKMRLGAIDLRDYFTALEYEPSHLTHRIRDGEKKLTFLRPPLYEQSSPYYKGATAKSVAH